MGLDIIRNEIFRGTTKGRKIPNKVQESRLKWSGLVLRRQEEYFGKRVMLMEVPEKRRRGRPKRGGGWLDTTSRIDHFQGEAQDQVKQTSTTHNSWKGC